MKKVWQAFWLLGWMHSTNQLQSHTFLKCFKFMLRQMSQHVVLKYTHHMEVYCAFWLQMGTLSQVCTADLFPNS